MSPSGKSYYSKGDDPREGEQTDRGGDSLGRKKRTDWTDY
jgi:hypothetical protein